MSQKFHGNGYSNLVLTPILTVLPFTDNAAGNFYDLYAYLATTTDAQAKMSQPFAGTLKSINMTATLGNNSLTGNLTVKLFKNGVDTGYSFTIYPTDQGGLSLPDIDIDFIAGDYFVWHTQGNGAGMAVQLYGFIVMEYQFD